MTQALPQTTWSFGEKYMYRSNAAEGFSILSRGNATSVVVETWEGTHNLVQSLSKENGATATLTWSYWEGEYVRPNSVSTLIIIKY